MPSVRTIFDRTPVPVAPRSHSATISPPHARLCVLASSSRGNCSALVLDGTSPGIVLIDLGLSPRRTHTLLNEAGLAHLPILAAVLTHLDIDHANPSWVRKLPEGVPTFMHKRHLGRARRDGLLYQRAIPFEAPFDPVPGVRFRPHLVSHDSLGTAAFRISTRAGDLGYATDLGRPSLSLAEHLAGVDVLAVESNYCPRLQAASSRPDFLKRRIMGGHGHLSNQESRDLVRDIAPRAHVILLHLSRECNRPEIAAQHHQGAPYALTISTPNTPTPLVPIGLAPILGQ